MRCSERGHTGGAAVPLPRPRSDANWPFPNGSSRCDGHRDSTVTPGRSRQVSQLHGPSRPLGSAYHAGLGGARVWRRRLLLSAFERAPAHAAGTQSGRVHVRMFSLPERHSQDAAGRASASAAVRRASRIHFVSQYRSDSEKVLSMAESCSSVDDLKPDASGSELQKLLAKVASKTEKGEFYYTRFFAIGLFRLLELTGAKDPKALERVVKSVGISVDNVNKDLLLYKSILSKMMAAKELMREVMEREKKKQQEREAVTKKDESPSVPASTS
eukprot:TRINITY_DN12139_c0_g1_i3.p1 TRINITY_DN12139_c0_g1~~TRINITY_DN12139_c0_g1_i3.p1  ORF type:complete len:272 (+),score=29.71 TRINITY_DN12139_c0_g1_i3:106-921(+)